MKKCNNLTFQGYAIARLESSGGDRLKIVEPQDAPAAHTPGSLVIQRHGMAHLTFIVPDVRAVIAVLRKADAPVPTCAEPVTFRPGVVDLAFAQDPEGNYFEFVQRNDLNVYRPAPKGAST